MMKKIAILLSVALLSACTPSLEKQATELVKNTLAAERPLTAKSYKSLSLTLDSAFVAPETDSAMLALTSQILEVSLKVQNIEKAHHRTQAALTLLENASNGLGRAGYEEERQKSDEQTSLIAMGRALLDETFLALKAREAQLAVGTPCGWRIRNECSGARLVGTSDYTFIANASLTHAFGYETAVYERLCDHLALLLASDSMGDYRTRLQQAALLQ